MLPPPSKIDRFFAQYGGKDKKYLCGSEVEPVPVKEILSVADDDLLQEWEDLTLCLNDPRGHVLLREEIAKLHNVTPDDVLVAVPQEAIYIAMNTLAQYLRGSSTGFHAVVTFPTYQSLHEDLRSLGVELSYWRAEYEDKTGWNFNIESLKQQLRDDTKLLVVNFPNNPTGFVPDVETWNEIVTLCKARNLFLFSDEMYRLSNNDGSLPLPSVCAEYQKSMLLFGMSKTFGMPGLRTGWLCSTDRELQSQMMQLRDYLTGSPPGPCEMLTTMALRKKQVFVDRALSIIQPNLKHIQQFCANHQDIFQWHSPQAGCAGFMRLKSWALEVGEGGASGFCKVLREETGLLLLPATIYDFEDEFVRVGFGRGTLEEYLKEFDEFIARKKKEIA